MKAPVEKSPGMPSTEDEVLRRMLNTPPTPHKPKAAPAKARKPPRRKP